MDAEKLVKDSLQILKENSKISSYFESNIQWLKQQLDYKKKNLTRIGLIGVTSSGKSTILNALLGENLLPTAVRPSSGVLITCSKSRHKQAIIYFENREPIVLTEDNMKSEITRYGDEKYNQANQYKVKHIDIESPHFLLDEGLQIIDSPGLDAYGLEYHEILTMETLLPSVDMCLYAVTMKANSDESTFQAIQTIEKHKKPFIIIQNMLDSVEAKKGKGGHIIKTKEQVAFEHKNRIKAIIDKVDGLKQTKSDLHSLISIVQLSAKDALLARINNEKKQLDTSGVLNLVELLKNNMTKLQALINKQRRAQVVRHIQELIENEKEAINELTAKNNRIKGQHQQLNTYINQEREIEKVFSSAIEAIHSRLKQIKGEAEKAVSQIDQLNEQDIDKAEALNDSLRKKVSGIEKGIIDITRNVNEKINLSMDALNFHPQDLQNDLLPKKAMGSKAFKVKSKIVQRTKWREKSGALSKVGRFFADIFDVDWGYEKVEYDVTILDTTAMKKHIKGDFTEILKELSQFVQQWEKRISIFKKKLREEIERKEKEIKQKGEVLLDEDILRQVIDRLKGIIKDVDGKQNQSIDKKELKASSKSAEDKTDGGDSAKRKKITIGSTLFGIYQLTNHFMYCHFQHLWNYCQHNNFNQKPFHQTVIWGWDEASLVHFTRRFLNHSLEGNELIKLRKQGFYKLIINKQKFILVNETKDMQKDFEALFKDLLEEDYNAYLLMNAMQMGAAMKQLKQSVFLKCYHSKPGIINWVNQSVLEFKDQNMGEGLKGLYSIIDEFNKWEHGYILLNDENPIYSMIMLELSQYNEVTVADEQKLISQVSSKYPYLLGKGEIEDCVQLMRSYKALKGVETA